MRILSRVRKSQLTASDYSIIFDLRPYQFSAACAITSEITYGPSINDRTSDRAGGGMAQQVGLGRSFVGIRPASDTTGSSMASLSRSSAPSVAIISYLRVNLTAGKRCRDPRGWCGRCCNVRGRAACVQCLA